MRSGGPLSDEVEMRLRQFRKDVVADQLVQKVINERAVVSEQEAHAFYDAHANEYLTEYRVSHILLNSLEEAEKVKSLIGKNGFAYLARRYSIDKHSGAGGDLGYLSKGNMLPEFENVVFGMKKGDVSDIIESEFGYHILTITDVREARVKLSFDDVREEIANNLMLQKRKRVYEDLVASLWAKADIEITEEASQLGVPAELDTLSRTP